MAVELASRALGSNGPPLVILHGMLGSSRNWLTAGRDLNAHFTVHALDLRNHGESPHADEAGYPTMAEDVVAWMNRMGMSQASVLGHSLGGKVGMYLACHYPDRVTGLVVADMAARNYAPHYAREVAALRALDVSKLPDRKEADRQLEAEVPDFAMRRFLLTNLARTKAGGFSWQCNLDAIARHLDPWSRNPLSPEDRYSGRTRLIHGALSPYVRAEDLPAMTSYFPALTVDSIPEAGHNVHVDQRAAFVRSVVAGTAG